MSLADRIEARHDRIQEFQSPNRSILAWFRDRKPETEQAASVLDTIKTNSIYVPLVAILEKLRAEVHVISEDGKITFSEVVQFAFRATQLFYSELAPINALDPVARKEVTMLALDEFYLRVIAPLDIPYVPTFVESSILDPMLGKLWHQAADGLYESIESMLS
jgi:hypothetical protein|tara:strand:+ start:571 stop:1059 length:489 start_codon:yes stop_codon:yes gene_type:complete